MNLRLRYLPLFFCFMIPGALSAVEGGKIVRTPAYSLKESANPANDFTSRDERLNVFWEPGENGKKGTLVIRILKGGKSKSWLGSEITGPLLKQEPANSHISRRDLHAKVSVRVPENLPPHGFRISYLDKTGKTVTSLDEQNREIIVMGRGLGFGRKPGTDRP